MNRFYPNGQSSVRSFRLFATLVFALSIPSVLKAQIISDPLLYTHQALNFTEHASGTFKPTPGLPGTSFADSYSSILDNPASGALFKKSLFDFGFSLNGSNEDTEYLGNKPSSDESSFSVNNFGVIYQFPTSQGALSIGAGFQQQGYFQRSMSINGFNGSHSITDQFKIPGSYYEGPAFDAYAIDYGDIDQTYLESIFRVVLNPGEFFGIDQQADVLESGTSGELNAYVATEFQQNLFVGVSVGLMVSDRRYERTFLEVDTDNQYSGDFIDTNDDGDGDTDLDQVLLQDDITSEATAPSIRLGAIYQIGNSIRVGASFRLPTVMSVTESYDATIRSTMDNGVFYQGTASGDFEYKIEQPGMLSLGFSFGSPDGLAGSFSFDRTNYAGIELIYDGVGTFLDEKEDTRYIQNNFDEVWDARGGLSYRFDSGLRLMWSYSNIPSRFKSGGVDRRFVQLGAELPISQNTMLIVGFQRSGYEQQSVLYNYEDGFFDYKTQTVDRDVLIYSAQGTLRFRF